MPIVIFPLFNVHIQSVVITIIRKRNTVFETEKCVQQN